MTLDIAVVLGWLIDSCDVLTPFDTAGTPPTPSPTCCFQTTCCNHVRWSILVMLTITMLDYQYWSRFMIKLTLLHARTSCRMRITEEQWDRSLVLMIMKTVTMITIVNTPCSLGLTTTTTKMIKMMMVVMMKVMMMMTKHLWSPDAVWCCIFQKCIGTPILHLASF